MKTFRVYSVMAGLLLCTPLLAGQTEDALAYFAGKNPDLVAAWKAGEDNGPAMANALTAGDAEQEQSFISLQHDIGNAKAKLERQQAVKAQIDAILSNGSSSEEDKAHAASLSKKIDYNIPLTQKTLTIDTISAMASYPEEAKKAGITLSGEEAMQQAEALKSRMQRSLGDKFATAEKLLQNHQTMNAITLNDQLDKLLKAKPDDARLLNKFKALLLRSNESFRSNEPSPTEKSPDAAPKTIARSSVAARAALFSSQPAAAPTPIPVPHASKTARFAQTVRRANGGAGAPTIDTLPPPPSIPAPATPKALPAPDAPAASASSQQVPSKKKSVRFAETPDIREYTPSELPAPQVPIPADTQAVPTTAKPEAQARQHLSIREYKNLIDQTYQLMRDPSFYSRDVLEAKSKQIEAAKEALRDPKYQTYREDEDVKYMLRNMNLFPAIPHSAAPWPSSQNTSEETADSTAATPETPKDGPKKVAAPAQTAPITSGASNYSWEQNIGHIEKALKKAHGTVKVAEAEAEWNYRLKDLYPPYSKSPSEAGLSQDQINRLGALHSKIARLNGRNTSILNERPSFFPPAAIATPEGHTISSEPSEAVFSRAVPLHHSHESPATPAQIEHEQKIVKAAHAAPPELSSSRLDTQMAILEKHLNLSKTVGDSSAHEAAITWNYLFKSITPDQLESLPSQQKERLQALHQKVVEQNGNTSSIHGAAFISARAAATPQRPPMLQSPLVVPGKLETPRPATPPSPSSESDNASADLDKAARLRQALARNPRMNPLIQTTGGAAFVQRSALRRRIGKTEPEHPADAPAQTPSTIARNNPLFTTMNPDGFGFLKKDAKASASSSRKQDPATPSATATPPPPQPEAAIAMTDNPMRGRRMPTGPVDEIKMDSPRRNSSPTPKKSSGIFSWIKNKIAEYKARRASRSPSPDRTSSRSHAAAEDTFHKAQSAQKTKPAKGASAREKRAAEPRTSFNPAAARRHNGTVQHGKFAAV